MEAEGAVALKGTPAVDGTGVTLFGMRSQAMQYGGSMGSLVETKQAVRLADALEEYGFSVIRIWFPSMRTWKKHMRRRKLPVATVWTQTRFYRERNSCKRILRNFPRFHGRLQRRGNRSSRKRRRRRCLLLPGSRRNRRSGGIFPIAYRKYLKPVKCRESADQLCREPGL